MRLMILIVLVAGGCAGGFDSRGLAKVDVLRLAQGKRGEGSAVVVGSDGELLTAAHLVDGADAIAVTLADGRRLVADVAASYPDADVARLRVAAHDLVAVPYANRSPAVGDQVRAYGRHAPGALGRVTGEDSPAEGACVYTDAAFGPGDSGGALVNARGELVGILLGEGTGGRLAAARPR